jgi:tRNA G10  N-methylase Trm11
LAAARKNLDEAGADWALLRRADARTFDPRAIGGRARGGMTAIITNPPMGRRVARGDDLEALLVNLVLRAPEILAPGGRLVWLSPLPRATRTAAERARLELRSAKSVDMGGFSAELQVLERTSD